MSSVRFLISRSQYEEQGWYRTPNPSGAFNHCVTCMGAVTDFLSLE